MAFDKMSARAQEALETSELTNPQTIFMEVLEALREPSPEFLKETRTDADHWTTIVEYLMNPYARGDG